MWRIGSEISHRGKERNRNGMVDAELAVARGCPKITTTVAVEEAHVGKRDGKSLRGVYVEHVLEPRLRYEPMPGNGGMDAVGEPVGTLSFR